MSWLGSAHSVEALWVFVLELLQHNMCGAYGTVAIDWFRTLIFRAFLGNTLWLISWVLLML